RRSSDLNRRALLVLLKRVEDQLPQLVLRSDVDDRTQQSEATPFAVHAVLPRGKRDISAGPSAAAFPDAESNQLEALERTVGEMQFGFGQFARRIPLVVWRNLDRHCSARF